MTLTTNTPVLERLIDPLSRCLTEESARRVLKLRGDAKLQARARYLADKCTEGTLTLDERAEYAHYVSFSTFVALLKSKARKLLARCSGH